MIRLMKEIDETIEEHSGSPGVIAVVHSRESKHATVKPR